MKKRIFKIAVLPLFFGMALTSCNKLLEVPETNFITAELALKTVPNTEQALIGAYAGLGMEMGIQLNGVFSDELKPGDFYAATSTHEWQYTSNDIGIRDSYTATTAYYYVIDRVNRLLAALPTATAATAAEETLRAKVKGEALFLRAFCHFELYRYYCENYNVDALAMPYMTEYVAEPTLDDRERIKQGPYFQQLLADLTEAKGLLPNNLTDIYRATRMAGVALHARVALYMRDWPTAITQATDYINTVPLASKAAFPGIWTDGNSSELSFKLRRTNANTRLGSFYRGVFTKNTRGDTLAPASISWVPSDKLFNSYDQINDIRFAAYVKDEPRLAAIANKPHKIVAKYAGTGYTSTNENVADVKVFRTSEMYLIRAEARAESNSITGALGAEGDLNTLRAARINNYVPVVLANKETAINEILQERYKELAFEGQRFFDIKRRGLAINRLASDAPTPAGQTLAAGNFRFLLPIPQAEMLANALMVQNPGYAN